MHSSVVALLLCSIAALGLVACSTRTAGLRYESAPETKLASKGAAISVGNFIDQRGDTPTSLGVIRAKFGYPVKILEGDQPAAELVKTGFTDGLKARGYRVSPDAPVMLSGTVLRLDADQYVRREANVEVVVRLSHSDDTTTVFEHTYTANRVEGSFFSLRKGMFGSIEDLRSLLQKTLVEVIDKALDDPQFRTALNRKRGRRK